MWRRTYLLLLLVRVYLALSPSYLHPDEHFQGPEIFAGKIFDYPSQLTWEFTSSHPIRSIFPLWLVYGLPMTLLKWLWTEAGSETPPSPYLIYYVLRGGMFVLSFVLEDWAIHELMSSPRRRRQAVVLVASSYVTWTYQAHTFSNSLETLLVAWALVLIQRILDNKQSSSIFACAILSFVAVVGVFNRITFPAFILIPGLYLGPHFLHKPLSFFSMLFFGLLFTSIAVYVDTDFYAASAISFFDIFRAPVVTPLNNLLYNSDTANLASHGLHPRYQHLLVNLPQLLGPAYILLARSFTSAPTFFSLRNPRAISAISATILLSIFPHQEPRFLIPCVPLLLTCFRPPNSRIFLASWVVFNAALGVLMGVYHQGGVIPAQLQMPYLLANSTSGVGSVIPSGTATVYWWKTYSPPLWLLGDHKNVPGLSFPNIETRDLMGMPGSEMTEVLQSRIAECSHAQRNKKAIPTEASSTTKITHDDPTLLVAPHSNTYLDRFTDVSGDSEQPFKLGLLWSYSRHINLDDLDFGDDGVWPTLKRVVGRRGLDVWLVTRRCD